MELYKFIQAIKRNLSSIFGVFCKNNIYDAIAFCNRIGVIIFDLFTDENLQSKRFEGL